MLIGNRVSGANHAFGKLASKGEGAAGGEGSTQHPNAHDSLKEQKKKPSKSSKLRQKNVTRTTEIERATNRLVS